MTHDSQLFQSEDFFLQRQPSKLYLLGVERREPNLIKAGR
jgi:hypothetical protein